MLWVYQCGRVHSFLRCRMRYLSALVPCVLLLASSIASADSHVFIVANQPDGYGVDQCLARGEKCGAHAALSYCRSRDFAQALSYRRVDPDEITGSGPQAGEDCKHARCDRYVGLPCPPRSARARNITNPVRHTRAPATPLS